jgi:hypothetical protein
MVEVLARSEKRFGARHERIPLVSLGWPDRRLVGRRPGEWSGFGVIGDVAVGIVGVVLGGFLFGAVDVGARRLLGAIDVARCWHRWVRNFLNRGNTMSIGTILLIILILMLLGVIPVWPHSRSWGYAPGGVLGLIVVILLILLLLGRL